MSTLGSESDAERDSTQDLIAPSNDIVISLDKGPQNDTNASKETDSAQDPVEDLTIKDATKPEEPELMQFTDILNNCTEQAEPTPNCAPIVPPTTGNYHIDCINRINQFRATCQCLPPLKRWKDGEACANEQSKYDSDKGQAHAGYNARICRGGGGQNECPRYRSEQHVIGTCLQQMWNEGPGEPFSEHGHYINMTNKRFSRVACGIFQGNNGTWAIQNFN